MLDIATREAIEEIRSDRTSGSSEILFKSLKLLDESFANATVREVAGGLSQAQPSMAAIWTVALQAVADEADPERFARFAARVRRSPDALIRYGVPFLVGDDPTAPLRIVSLSFSGTVSRLVEAVARARPIEVACAEGRPALEGQRMASILAAAGAGVTFYTDAAVGAALDGADMVLLGADAVTSDRFLNKVGTRLLCAAAMQRGVPIHVVATREKFVHEAVAARLAIREGHPDEVWPGAPAAVRIRNPYFEWTPLDLMTSAITDAGILGAALVPALCADAPDPARLDDLAR